MPKLLSLLKPKVPEFTVVAPVKVLLALSVNWPAPSWRKTPVPAITSATPMLSERLNINVPLLVTVPVPKLPVVPELPTCAVPELIVVPPV